MYAISQLRPMGISILHTLGNINYWQYTKISPEMLLKSTQLVHQNVAVFEPVCCTASCTVGSYALLSVCLLSVVCLSVVRTIVDNNSYLKKYCR